MLLGKKTIKKANTYIDFTNNKIIAFDEEVPVKFSYSVHYCNTIGKDTDSNEKLAVQENKTYFSSNASEMDIQEKKKGCIKTVLSV